MQVETSVKPRVVRQYSAAERANALALYDNVGNLEKTSETLGIPLSTLAGWVNDPSNHSELRSQKSSELARKFQNAANLFLDLAIKKSKKANFNHLMTASGIAVDKSQLLNGLPTDISASVGTVELTVTLADALADVIDVTPEK